MWVEYVHLCSFFNGRWVSLLISISFHRRAALQIWKRRLGSDATYQKLIDIFECAWFRTYAEIVRNTVCDAESETDDSSDYEEPIPQPETYPCLKISPPSSPKLLSRRFSLCDEYFLVNQATTQGLPEGENCIWLTLS